jgi:hypothetical protein
MSSPRPNWGAWERESTAEHPEHVAWDLPDKPQWPAVLGALVMLIALAGLVALVIVK